MLTQSSGEDLDSCRGEYDVSSVSSSMENDPVLLQVKADTVEKSSTPLAVAGFLVLLRIAVLLFSVHSAGFAGKGSIYVPGGGFSGFWYTLGRLQAIQHPMEREYYCYSSGCLAVVAMMQNYSRSETQRVALDIQKRWLNGNITRYEVVAAFVEDITENPPDDSVLARIKIISSVPTGNFGMKATIRTPTSVSELRTMLLQTTWIPYAIGKEVWYFGHMDGAFTIEQHPVCEVSIRSPLSYLMVANALNVHLQPGDVELLWKTGFNWRL